MGVKVLGKSTHLIVGSADGVKVKALVLVVQLGAAQAALIRRARHAQVPVNKHTQVLVNRHAQVEAPTNRPAHTSPASRHAYVPAMLKILSTPRQWRQGLIVNIYMHIRVCC